MNYLEAVDVRTIVVHPARRDWGDYDVDAHVQYHRDIMSRTTGQVTIQVDASAVPTCALLHTRTFFMIAKIARSDFKDRVKEILIYNPSVPVLTLYKLLRWWGCIGSDTYSKIRLLTHAGKSE